MSLDSQSTVVFFLIFTLFSTVSGVCFPIREEGYQISFPDSIIYVDTGFNAFFLFYFGLRVSARYGKGELKLSYIWEQFTCVNNRCSVT